LNTFIPMNDTHNKTNTTGRNHRNTIVSLSEKKMDEMNKKGQQYKLKEYIKFYAKYLGLDPDVVMDTFNEFLFEKTSKISLEDIKEAQERAIVKEREEKSKVRSPYTIIRKKKIDVWPIIIWFGIVLVAISIALLLVKNISKEPIRSSELKKGMEEFYEFTY